jgi:hypothetical protein
LAGIGRIIASSRRVSPRRPEPATLLVHAHPAASLAADFSGRLSAADDFRPGAAALWQELTPAQARRLGPPRLKPGRYRVLALDLPALKKQLAPATPAAGPTLWLPLAAGGQQAFQMRASSVMAPELAARYPELQTYAGTTAGRPADYVRLEITPTGLHALLVCAGRTLLIEPYRPGDTRHYLVFDKATLPAGSKAAFEVPGGPLR